MWTLLAEGNVHTTTDLRKVRAQIPAGLRHRIAQEPCSAERFRRVALVAADITTQVKVVLPEMGDLYWIDYDCLNPAEFVRASTSIPFFFTPYRVASVPQRKEAWTRWSHLAGYNGEVPDSVVFVDGGVMSNFPIDLFHNFTKAPSAPTFGACLGLGSTKPTKTQRLSHLLLAIFDSARHVHNYDFIARNPDCRYLVRAIDTEEHN